MKVRFVPLALITSLLLLFGAVAAACDGDGNGEALTLEEFFREVEALDDEFETRSDEIDATIDDLSEEEFLEQAPDLLGEQAGLVREFIDGLSELEPPDEAAELHAEAVSAGREVVDIFNSFVGDVEAAESIDELFAVFDQEEFDAAFERFEQVCFDAEQLAADNGIA